MFACEPIKKGRYIARYSGRKIDTDKADELNNKYLFEINTRWTIDGSSRRNIGRYANHSCRPNAESHYLNGKIILRAIKIIRPGDEITYDYGTDYYRNVITPRGCKCVKCRQKRRDARRAQRVAKARRLARLRAKSRKPG